MRRFGYGLGVMLVVFAAATGVAHLLAFLSGAAAQPVSLGSLWYGVHANSLVGFQGLIERGVSPALWPPILWLLLLPAWLTFGVPGLALVLLCRRRSRGFD
ncbi:MAG TPA: hypothetical protein VFG43_14135 [Geminicoccaceae bacterium]|nr:hypothetical protein [Geminicoccaceae bacterium]